MVEPDWTFITETLKKIHGGQADLRNAMMDMRNDIRDLKDGVRDLKEGQSRHERHLLELRSDLLRHAERMAALEIHVERIETRLDPRDA